MDSAWHSQVTDEAILFVLGQGRYRQRGSGLRSFPVKVLGTSFALTKAGITKGARE